MISTDERKKLAAQRTREWYRANRDRALKTAKENYVKNKDRAAKYGKEYHAKHRENDLARDREYYWRNRDARLALAAQYNATHKEQRRKYNRERYQRKRDQIRDQVRTRRQANRAIDAHDAAVKLARKVAAPGQFTPSDWRALVARSPYCYWCRKQWTKSRRPTHDHIIALVNGGANSPENSVCACHQCNCRKRASRFNPNNGQGILL